MKKQITFVCTVLLMGLLAGGCGAAEKEQTTTTEEVSAVESSVTQESSTETAAELQEEEKEAQLADGVYLADFDTDSSMFHVNESCGGKGTLTVEDGKMTIHISLASQKILNLYPGLAQDAEKEGAELLNPTLDEVTYSDGTTEEVNGFDVPVPALDEEFDLALIGTKQTWYDHKVKVSNPEPLTEEADETNAESAVEVLNLEDGSYTAEITFEGGSGKAKILSPVTLIIDNQAVTARLEWSSPNYDYMIVDGEKYLPVNTEGNSIFEVPVSAFDTPVTVIGDTVAMSTPHEIEYTITFLSETVNEAE